MDMSCLCGALNLHAGFTIIKNLTLTCRLPLMEYCHLILNCEVKNTRVSNVQIASRELTFALEFIRARESFTLEAPCINEWLHHDKHLTWSHCKEWAASSLHVKIAIATSHPWVITSRWDSGNRMLKVSRCAGRPPFVFVPSWRWSGQLWTESRVPDWGCWWLYFMLQIPWNLPLRPLVWLCLLHVVIIVPCLLHPRDKHSN